MVKSTQTLVILSSLSGEVEQSELGQQAQQG
jgi:hypothetical protein